MKKRHLFSLSTLVVLFLFACESKDSSTSSLTYEMRAFVKRHCVNNEQCADFNVYPAVFSGADTALVAAVNRAVQARLVAGLDGNASLPYEAAVDSAGLKFIEQFIQLKRDIPEQEMSQMIQVTSNVLLNTPKCTTVRLDFVFNTGGAHPNTASAVMSFDLKNKGQQLKATDLLRDTSAVLPMLEKAYKKSKGLKDTDDIGQLLITQDKKLPLPINIGIIPEGILFAYSDYEVAPHAVGPTDIILTWADLGDLGDKSKWVQ